MYKENVTYFVFYYPTIGIPRDFSPRVPNKQPIFIRIVQFSILIDFLNYIVPQITPTIKQTLPPYYISVEKTNSHLDRLLEGNERIRNVAKRREIYRHFNIISTNFSCRRFECCTYIKQETWPKGPRGILPQGNFFFLRGHQSRIKNLE